MMYIKTRGSGANTLPGFWLKPVKLNDRRRPMENDANTVRNQKW
jgi:hypothetical protein